MKKIGAMIGFGIVLVSCSAWAEEAGQKKYGVVQNIAEDRVVERVGGIYEPEGIDKYMKRRFDMLADQLNKMDSRLANIESQITGIVTKMEEQERAAKEKKEPLPVTAEERKPPRVSGTGILVGSSITPESEER